MLYPLYKLIWLVLQMLASLYEAVYFIYLRLQTLLHWSYDFRHSSAEIRNRDRTLLQKCKDELTKIPRHLNLIIGPDPRGNINDTVVERILSYALVVGIEWVSIYDVRSESMGRIELDKICATRKTNWKELRPNQYEWRPTENASIVTKSHTKTLSYSNGVLMNGAVSDKRSMSNGDACHSHRHIHEHLKIYQLSEQDNRPLLAKICRELFKQRNTPNVQNLLDNRKQLEQYITDELAKYMHWEKIVDPELSIIFNTFTCTYGVLPWQTRFTEFHTFETGRCINAENFVKVLYRYSKCEQRWGK
ncbi:uncharacterized protein Tango14 [Eurosta solidaginis]|uniref:uncharacterized protein Tango14 n=1 Tax=Eurosta solidaginis TaxID=178769 RepID=UPI003530F5FB